MPRPIDIDSELLAKWEAELATIEQTPPSGMEYVFANPMMRETIHEVSLAGKWLESELMKENFNMEYIEKFRDAFGQRCFAVPDVWELAERTLVLYKKHRQQPDLYVTRDFPEDERRQLFETYTRVHSG